MGFPSLVVEVRDRSDESRRGWLLQLGPVAVACLVSLFACGRDSGSSPGDQTAPAPVNDLMGVPLGPGEVELQWTAVGDDGLSGRAEGIEIRIHREALVAESWGAASLVWAARPAPPGEPESVVLRGLPRGVHHFGLRTSDSSGNLSALSNDAAVEVGGAAAPSAVTDLAVAVIGDHTLRLTWTTPAGEDDSAATVYDMRYDSEALTPASWEEATRVVGLSQPGPPGSPDSVTIADLDSGTRYFVALRSAVQTPNWSPLSNVAAGTTQQYVRLTSAAGSMFVLEYSWSPDGRELVYALTDPSSHPRERLFGVRADGAGTRPISGTDYDARVPAWSPDGEEIAFERTWFEADGNPPVDHRFLSVVPSPGLGPPEDLVPIAVGLISSVAWSPDGSELAYAVILSGFPPIRELRVVPRQGGDPRTLVEPSPTLGAPIRWSGWWRRDPVRQRGFHLGRPAPRWITPSRRPSRRRVSDLVSGPRAVRVRARRRHLGDRLIGRRAPSMGRRSRERVRAAVVARRTADCVPTGQQDSPIQPLGRRGALARSRARCARRRRLWSW